MPNFNFNPADSSAGFPVYPKGTYEITLGEPKAFLRAGKNGKEDNYGIAFISKISGAEDSKYIGKKFAVNIYQHTSESRDMGKLIQMAALGYTKQKEEDFDQFSAELDWSFNPDDNSVGSGWTEMAKNVLVVDLDQKMNEDGDSQQVTKNWRPLAG